MADTGAKHSAGAQFQVGGRGEPAEAGLGSSQQERRMDKKWYVGLDFDFE